MFTKSQKDIRYEFIQNVREDEKYRRPSPATNFKWDQEDFIEYVVQQNNQPIKLHTYLCFSMEPKSITFFFHGLNEHMGMYSHIAQTISKQANSIVVGIDFRGFGKSQGAPGLIENTDQLIRDCEGFIKLIKEKYNHIGKYFCLGQSMGGMASYQMGMRNACDGTILITPAIMDNTYNSKYGKLFAQCFGYLFPGARLVRNDNNIHENKNPQILEDFNKDPYAYKEYLIPGTIKMIVDNMKQLPNTFRNYKCPFLIIAAGMDKLIDPDVGKQLMERSPSLDKSLIYKENMWHNAIMEEEIEEIMPQMVEWIIKRS